MYQQHYQHFLDAHPGQQHFACHSHYYWPDVTRQAMLDYWDDSARYADNKWSHFFSHAVPAVQQGISGHLNTGQPEQIVFAPNTHELVMRLFSCLDSKKKPAVLSTDSEFHSFTRQAQRLVEDDAIALTKIPTLPLVSFAERFAEAIRSRRWDMIFISQVFFNSGFGGHDLVELVRQVEDPDTLIVIDGYHGFMALPTDLAPIADRVFYLAGGYKYAQAGEGVCFAHVPTSCRARPVYTGWFAEFGALDQPRQQAVSYADNGMRFAGATMDYCALYRQRAVFDWLDSLQLNVAAIDAHVKQVQAAFLSQLEMLDHRYLQRANLLVNEPAQRGHFLTFTLPDAQTCADLAGRLHQHGILTDYRDARLRFGFALYHSADTLDLDPIRHC